MSITKFDTAIILGLVMLWFALVVVLAMLYGMVFS
jgi:hypothetical protein